MKPDIHPKYSTSATATCACGNSFKTGSVTEQIETEICSDCHPFYTGKQKILDTTGNVDRFKKRREAGVKATSSKIDKKPRKDRTSKS